MKIVIIMVVIMALLVACGNFIVKSNTLQEVNIGLTNDINSLGNELNQTKLKSDQLESSLLESLGTNKVLEKSLADSLKVNNELEQVLISKEDNINSIEDANKGLTLELESLKTSYANDINLYYAIIKELEDKLASIPVVIQVEKVYKNFTGITEFRTWLASKTYDKKFKTYADYLQVTAFEEGYFLSQFIYGGALGVMFRLDGVWVWASTQNDMVVYITDNVY